MQVSSRNCCVSCCLPDLPASGRVCWGVWGGVGEGGWCRQLRAFVGRAPTPLSAALRLHMAPVPPVAEAAGLTSRCEWSSVLGDHLAD